MGEDEEASRMIGEATAATTRNTIKWKIHLARSPSANSRLNTYRTTRRRKKPKKNTSSIKSQPCFTSSILRQKNDAVVAKNVRSENVRIESRSTLGVGEGTVGEVCERFAETETVEGLPDYSEAARKRADSGENSQTEDGEKGEKSEKNRWVRPKRAWHMDRLKHDLTVSKI